MHSDFCFHCDSKLCNCHFSHAHVTNRCHCVFLKKLLCRNNILHYPSPALSLIFFLHLSLCCFVLDSSPCLVFEHTDDFAVPVKKKKITNEDISAYVGDPPGYAKTPHLQFGCPTSLSSCFGVSTYALLLVYFFAEVWEFL